MDTTPTNIAMLAAAVEIQAAWKPIHHDMFFYRNPNRHNTLSPQYIDGRDWNAIMISVEYFKRSKIWVPRQDQLQEMVKDISPIPSGLLWEFARWQDNATFSRYGLKSWEDLTFEKLWLGFVMDKKYGKIWNGKEWIKG